MNVGHRATEKTAFDLEARGQVFDLKQHFVRSGDWRHIRSIPPQKAHRTRQVGARHLAQLGHRRQQRLGVGVLRILEDFFDRAFLNLIAPEHDHNAVSHLRDNRHIVGDEHHCRAGLALKSVHQGKDFRLNGHVQCRGRFVRNQQPRFARQCHRDDHALPHPARQFVRILLETPFGFRDAHLTHQIQRPRLGLRLGHVLVQP